MEFLLAPDEFLIKQWGERICQLKVLSVTVQSTKATGAMPSARYYRQRARTLLAWSKATKDKAYAAQLRLRAANELEQAEHALLSELKARQVQREG